MKRTQFFRITTTGVYLCALLLGVPSSLAAASLDHLILPDDFQIALYADNVPNARQMVLGEKGTVFVGSRRAGAVYALRDNDGDFRAERRYTIASGLTMPSGVAFRDGALIVAAVNQILRFPNIEKNLTSVITPELIRNDLPSATHHGWKFIRYDSNGDLYVPVGVPCNICVPKNKLFGTILKLSGDQQQWTIVARGIRNSVGFDWHPQTGELWFSENGRDSIGDAIPPDEINRVSKIGQHFGFPYVYGDNISQPEFDGRNNPDYETPALNLQAHVAPLGVHFYRGKLFPNKYQHALFVAEHGSWDRSSKVGYRVMVAFIAGNKVTHYEPFIEGWLYNESVSGRPVAFLEMPDGSLLISDDKAGAIYRVSYNK